MILPEPYQPLTSRGVVRFAVARAMSEFSFIVQSVER
jgi:hypothetical protein